MTYHPHAALDLDYDLVEERIRRLHQEAADARLASRIRSVQKARRQVERASERLRNALSRA